MKAKKTVEQLVVVGSSAGGIEALSRVISDLSPTFPAAIVVAQHLDPERPSHLGDILARLGTLKVKTVDGLEKLEPGVVYVVPSNRDVEITDHSVALLKPAPDSKSKPSVNLLFTTAAAAFREHLTAVVLSGTGSDGALGARVVHDAGGTVVVQNPDTAAFGGMPRSLAPATVDASVEIGELAGVLTNLVAHPRNAGNPEDEAAFDAILRLVHEGRGVDFSQYRQSTIHRRLERRIAATSSGSIEAYARLLEGDADEQQRLAATFLIKVTDFFRDPKTFVHLRERVLPDLVAHAGPEGLRIWSAGCATGEEAYSIAILAADTVAAAKQPIPVRIFATDLDEEALAFARRGVYPANSLSEVPADLVSRYFRSSGGECEVPPAVRDTVVFGQHDFSRGAPLPRIDLVLCRNVLMYFTPALQKRALEAFAFSLRKGGILALGSAETVRLADTYFQRESQPLKLFRRTQERLAYPIASVFVSAGVPARRAAIRRSPALVNPEPLPPGEQKAAAFNRTLIGWLPVGIAVLKPRYEIEYINPTARRLLGIHGSAIGDDLVHLTDLDNTRALRDAIDGAFRGDIPEAVVELVRAEMALGVERNLQISCRPLPGDDGGADGFRVLVSVSDITSAAAERDRAVAAAEATREEIERLSRLMGKMSETNRGLLKANEELAVAEERFRAASEEQLSLAAQAQAASEELETYNEELQATGEELEALNEELKGTVEELMLSNADLDARSEALAQEHETSERSRAELEATLASMSDGVVVVDREGHVVRTNAAYDQLYARFGELTDEQGDPLPPGARPLERAQNGDTFDMTCQAVGTDGNELWLEASGRPLTHPRGEAGMAVVVVRDVTDRSLLRLQERFVGIVAHELRNPLTLLLGFLELHRRGLKKEPVSEAVVALADDAVVQAERLRALVRDLLDVTRTHQGQFKLDLQPVDLVEVVRQTVEVARVGAEGHPILLETAAASAIVRGDAPRLHEVFLNMLLNALKYAPGPEPIVVRAELRDHKVAVSVADEGPGIPESSLPFIFSSYYKAQTPAGPGGGLGLGLFIAHEIVKGHGGTIDVRSYEGKGTVFTVWLPLAQMESEALLGRAGPRERPPTP